MTPEIEEAIKRLESLHLEGDAITDAKTFYAVKEVCAELRRLSAPVVGTYKEACAMACPWCRGGFKLSEPHRTHHWTSETTAQPCTAPTELEWGEQNARRVVELRMESVDLIDERNAALDEVARLRGVLEQYADPKNWTRYDYEHSVNDCWVPLGHGYELADRALKGTE